VTLEDPIEELARELRERREEYGRTVLDSQPFKDGLRYLNGIANDFLVAQTYVRLQASRDPNGDRFLLLRFAPHLAESALAITMNARQGLQTRYWPISEFSRCGGPQPLRTHGLNLDCPLF
jgi:hypothetical protein